MTQDHDLFVISFGYWLNVTYLQGSYHCGGVKTQTRFLEMTETMRNVYSKWDAT